MWKLARLCSAIAGAGVVAVLAASGCAQVFGIDDWSTAPPAGGSGGDSTGAAGQGSGGTAGGTMVVEVCNNALDDDSDGQIDCADPECGDFACVPPAPPGWEGPVEVVEGNPLPACRDGWSSSVDLGSGQLTAPEATCSPCSCSSPSGGSCELAPGALLEVYPMGQCINTPVGYMVNQPFQCIELTTGTSLSTAMELHADANLSKGACQPGGGDATVPEPFFEKNSRACQPAALGAGCGADQVCMPKPMPADTSAVCVYSQDLAAGSCPPEYPNSRLLNAILSDTRGCLPCTCNAPVGQLCSISAIIYSDSLCANSVKGLPNQTCDVVGSPHSFKVQVGGPNGGVCDASGGTPAGTVDLDTTIVCCR
jgi:hypothetical protein